MNSRITIDVNEDNQPVIKIQYVQSEDVRDKLVGKFIETFGYSSVWARYDSIADFKNGKVLELYPIKPSNLEEESKAMKAWSAHIAD